MAKKDRFVLVFNTATDFFRSAKEEEDRTIWTSLRLNGLLTSYFFLPLQNR